MRRALPNHSSEPYLIGHPFECVTATLRSSPADTDDELRVFSAHRSPDFQSVGGYLSKPDKANLYHSPSQICKSVVDRSALRCVLIEP